jgi:hypothetical protein
MSSCVLKQLDRNDETFGSLAIGSYDPMFTPTVPKKVARVKSALAAAVIALTFFAVIFSISSSKINQVELEDVSFCPPDSELPPG